MPDDVRIQDLSAREIAALLARSSEDVPNEHAGALRNFINDIGGIENAYAAVKVLSQLEERNDQ